MDGWMDGWTDGRTDGRTDATAQMNPEDTMLSERNQTQKDKYCMIPPI